MKRDPEFIPLIGIRRDGLIELELPAGKYRVKLSQDSSVTLDVAPPQENELRIPTIQEFPDLS